MSSFPRLLDEELELPDKRLFKAVLKNHDTIFFFIVLKAKLFLSKLFFVVCMA